MFVYGSLAPKKKSNIEESRSIECCKRVMVKGNRVPSTKVAVPLVTKRKNEDALGDVSRRRKKPISENTTVPQNESARSTKQSEE
jgi:hypothetical protein